MRRSRRSLVYVLLVAATVTGLLAIFAIWVQRQALDTAHWTDTSSALLEDPAIRSALAAFLIDELYAGVDVDGEIRDALPEELKRLADPVAGAVREPAREAIEAALERPAVQEVWAEANRTAHASLLAVLEEGEEDVALDLNGLLQDVAGRLGVSAAVPQDAARLVVLREDQLVAAREGASLIRSLAVVLTVLSLGLFAVAVALARGWRRVALRGVGIGFVVAGGLALALRGLAGDMVVDALAATASAQRPVESVWSISTGLLADASVATIAYGVVILVAAWLAGPTRSAVACRRALAPYLRQPHLAYGGLGAVLLLMLVWGPTEATRRVVPTLVLAALLTAGMEMLRRQAAREFPAAPPGPPAPA